MKKDIYIIRNDVNNKIYIGQAKTTSLRWSGHKSAARCHGGFIEIDKAMAKLGIEHFTCEVIEKQIENYDEREKYWIQYYNCRIPNGYNVEEGGEGAKFGIENSCAVIKDQKIIDSIIEELRTTDKKLDIIADEYDISKKIISAINRGTSYAQDGIDYPIRKRAADQIFDINSLQEELAYSKKSKILLAKEYNISKYIIDQIDKGKKYYDEKYSYPLRNSSLTKKQVKEIQDMIINTSFSLREIARQCNTSYTTVAHINSGKYHHNDLLQYPIRQYS